MKKILILFAHPAQEKSEVNVPLIEAAQKLDHVTVVDLYGEYPKFRINIEREQQRLIEHDVIVFKFPFYWYSTPAILKEWQDLVLEHGFAYGGGANALHGKSFLCALSAGGPESAYQTEGFNHFTVRDLLHPLEQTANLCGMTYLAPFVIFSARTAAEEHRLSKHRQDFVDLLTALRDETIDTHALSQAPLITENLSTFLRGSP